MVCGKSTGRERDSSERKRDLEVFGWHLGSQWTAKTLREGRSLIFQAARSLRNCYVLSVFLNIKPCTGFESEPLLRELPVSVKMG